ARPSAAINTNVEARALERNGELLMNSPEMKAKLLLWLCAAARSHFGCRVPDCIATTPKRRSTSLQILTSHCTVKRTARGLARQLCTRVPTLQRSDCAGRLLRFVCDDAQADVRRPDQLSPFGQRAPEPERR